MLMYKLQSTDFVYYFFVWGRRRWYGSEWNFAWW